MKRLTFLMAIFAFALLSAGCGQSGPLYIASDPSQMAVPPSRDSASEDEQDEEQESDESSDPN